MLFVLCFSALITIGTNLLSINYFLKDTYAESSPSESNDIATPFQKAVKEIIQKAKSEGRPHPEASFEGSIVQNEIVAGKASARVLSSLSQPPTNITTINARTILEFDTPEEAGLDMWPLLESNISTSASIMQQDSSKSANATQLLIENYPQIYGPDGYDYGEEPRTLVIDETLIVTELERRISNTFVNSHSTSFNDVVMGFTIDRLYEYSREESLQVFGIDLVTARIEFNAALTVALRLPVTVGVETPAALEPNNSYVFSTSVIPRNFDADDYERVGLPALDGREFAAEAGLLLRANLDIIFLNPIEYETGLDINVGDLCRELYDVDCEDFVTPFGVDENGDPREFPIPSILLDPELTGLLVPFDTAFLGFPIASGWIGIGIRIDPDFGSDKITVNYLAGDAATGNGLVTYTESSPAQFEFGPITVGNTGDKATVGLDEFKFFLDRMILEFAANLQSKGSLFMVIPYFVQSPYLDIFEFNLADIIGEPVIGQHEGTTGIAFEIPVIKLGENVLQATDGTIGLGGTTSLIQKIDTSSGVSGRLLSLTVLEPDGDLCGAAGLPDLIPPSGVLERAYPKDFEPLITNGDGICTTLDVGLYNAESQIDISGGKIISARTEFETNFFVIPESAIGPIALVASSLTALAGFLYWKRSNKSSDGIIGIGI